MRRRAPDGDDQLPDELMVFDGDPYSTQAAWQAAFDEFHDARDEWAKRHGLESWELPPYQRVGRNCPFDPTLI